MPTCTRASQTELLVGHASLRNCRQGEFHHGSRCTWARSSLRPRPHSREPQSFRRPCPDDNAHTARRPWSPAKFGTCRVTRRRLVSRTRLCAFCFDGVRARADQTRPAGVYLADRSGAHLAKNSGESCQAPPELVLSCPVLSGPQLALPLLSDCDTRSWKSDSNSMID